MFEAVWYVIFLNQWLAGIGRTRDWLMHSVDRIPEPLQYATALVCAVVMATAISCVVQLTGPQTAYRGMRVATALWMGFSITVWATEYVFEVRPWSLLAINAGFWLIGMNLMGVDCRRVEEEGPGRRDAGDPRRGQGVAQVCWGRVDGRRR